MAVALKFLDLTVPNGPGLAFYIAEPCLSVISGQMIIMEIQIFVPARTSWDTCDLAKAPI